MLSRASCTRLQPLQFLHRELFHCDGYVRGPVFVLLFFLCVFSVLLLCSRAAPLVNVGVAAAEGARNCRRRWWGVPVCACHVLVLTVLAVGATRSCVRVCLALVVLCGSNSWCDVCASCQFSFASPTPQVPSSCTWWTRMAKIWSATTSCRCALCLRCCPPSCSSSALRILQTLRSADRGCHCRWRASTRASSRSRPVGRTCVHSIVLSPPPPGLARHFALLPRC